MSYCVHCGVKLAASERRCPLCACPVNDPVEPFDPRSERVYPPRTREQELQVNHRAVLTLSAVLLMVPAAICLLVDLMSAGGVTWSVYPLGALMMLLCTVTAVVLGGRYAAYLGVIVGDGGLCLYLWMVQAVSGGGIWFQAVVFPVLLLMGIMALAMLASLHQHVLHGLAVPAVLLALVGILALAVDLLINVTLHGALTITWSGYVMIPCGVIALMLLIIHRNDALRSQLKRTLHL